MTPVRTFPIRLAPLPGEALDSWLEALAHRLNVRLGDVLNELGLASPFQHGVREVAVPTDWTIALHEEEAARVAHTTGTDPQQLWGWRGADLAGGGNLVIGAFRRTGFANIAHARRYHARDDQRILAPYGYTRNRHRAYPITNSRQGVSWLALTRSLRRSLARARRSDADVHLLLSAACPDDDRHAGRVINPVPARVGQPSAAAHAGAVADHDSVTGRARRAPPDAEPIGEPRGNDELERGARPDDQTGLRE